MAADMRDEKLQKVLARAGFGSRRELEQWISEGRVRVNGRVAELGTRVNDEDRIMVDGRKVRRDPAQSRQLRVLLYNKPEGQICSRHDPRGRPSVFDQLPSLPHGRWISVGRLDFNTSGLLLFTNSGDLANRLMHPSTGIDREYAVRVRGDVSDAMIERMLTGVDIDGDRCRFTDVQYFAGEGSNRWYHVVLMEGRNREVRRLWESQGVRVSRLKRVRFGPIFIPSAVKSGQHRELERQDVDTLLEAADIRRQSIRV